MKKLYILAAIFLLSQNILHAQYRIDAELNGFKDQTKFYLKDNAIDANIDSALIVGGKFVMEGNISSVKNFWLYTMYQGKFLYVNLLIGGDKIKVQGDAKDFPRNISITGSASQDVANKLNVQTRSIWKSRDSVVNILMPLAMGELQNDSIKTITKPLSKQLKQLDSAREVITTKFIAENLNSYAALQELYYQRDKYTIQAFEQLFAKVKSPYKEGKYGTSIANYIKVGNPLKNGDSFYDFEAADFTGKKYKVSDYKGKYILIDFTETYCGPCILAAENLKKIAAAYPQIQLLTFYAETNKKVMKEGLDRDKFTWPTLWDGKGTFSEITLKYGVDGYPSFVLINPEGKVVAKLSGFGKDENGKGNIENEVERILQKAK